MSYDEMKISKLGDACCGCGACAAKCPKSCISMQEDKFGFLHPVIDAGACVGCHACESVCPALGGGKCDEALGIRWAKGKSSELLEASSSGGIFGLLAESVIADGGVVCGAAWADGCRRVEHVLVEDAASLDCVMRSKYVQSRIGRGGLRWDSRCNPLGSPCPLRRHGMSDRGPQALSGKDGGEQPAPDRRRHLPRCPGAAPLV